MEKVRLELPARAKKCPFCGDKPRLYRTNLGYGIFCESIKCKERFVCTGVQADTIPLAVDKWNKRGGA